MIDRYNCENQLAFSRKPKDQSGFIYQTRITVTPVSYFVSPESDPCDARS